MLVISAPDERELTRLLVRVDRVLFRADDVAAALPLLGRKLHVHSDWGRERDHDCSIRR